MRVFVYGSQSFAETVRDLALDAGLEVMGFVDDHHRGTGILGTLEQVTRTYGQDDHGLLLGIGYNNLAARWQAWERVRAAGWQTPSVVHPRAYVAASAALGPACLVMAGAIIDRAVNLGQAVTVWPGACINHDTRIGDNTFISPGVTICGNARIGSHCFIGAGSVIVDSGWVPDSAYVKMGTRYTRRDV